MAGKSKHIDKKLLKMYLSGELKGADAYEFERLVLERKFEADAVEGAGSISSEDYSSDLAALESRLEERVGTATAGTGVNFGFIAKIAAGIAVVAVAGYFTYDLVNRNSPGFEQISGPIAESSISDSLADSRQNEIDTSMIALNEVGEVEIEEIADETMAEGEETKPEEFLVEEEPGLLADAETSVTDTTQFTITEDLDVSQPIVMDELTSEDLSGISRIEVDSMVTEAEKDVSNENMTRLQETRAAKRKEAAPSMAAMESFDDAVTTIKGKVYAEGESDPIPGVNVIIKGTTTGTLTDLNGNYSISASPGETLVFSYIGMSSREIPVTGTDPINVTLASDVTALEEVVVTGYGYSSGSEEVVKVGARPVDGYSSFRNYVKENLRYPETAKSNNITGRVVVLFTVNSNGSLSNFRIRKSLGYGCDEEAIRLIKEGPAWQPGSAGDASLTEEMRVTIRFKE